jgi:hypothetical protein
VRPSAVDASHWITPTEARSMATFDQDSREFNYGGLRWPGPVPELVSRGSGGDRRRPWVIATPAVRSVS